VNRISAEDLLQYDALILGTPTYGINQLPGNSTGIKAGSWEEFLPQLEDLDFSGKRIALYGLGNQEKYTERFADSLIHLYRFFSQRGAEMIGAWETNGYSFEHSQSVVDGSFVGLVLDQQSQPLLTDQRITDWLSQVAPLLIENIPDVREAMA
jgi:flavodoxin I